MCIALVGFSYIEYHRIPGGPRRNKWRPFACHLFDGLFPSIIAAILTLVLVSFGYLQPPLSAAKLLLRLALYQAWLSAVLYYSSRFFYLITDLPPKVANPQCRSVFGFLSYLAIPWTTFSVWLLSVEKNWKKVPIGIGLELPILLVLFLIRSWLRRPCVAALPRDGTVLKAILDSCLFVSCYGLMRASIFEAEFFQKKHAGAWLFALTNLLLPFGLYKTAKGKEVFGWFLRLFRCQEGDLFRQVLLRSGFAGKDGGAARLEETTELLMGMEKKRLEEEERERVEKKISGESGKSGASARTGSSWSSVTSRGAGRTKTAGPISEFFSALLGTNAEKDVWERRKQGREERRGAERRAKDRVPREGPRARKIGSKKSKTEMVQGSRPPPEDSPIAGARPRGPAVLVQESSTEVDHGLSTPTAAPQDRPSVSQLPVVVGTGALRVDEDDAPVLRGTTEDDAPVLRGTTEDDAPVLRGTTEDDDEPPDEEPEVSGLVEPVRKRSPPPPPMSSALSTPADDGPGDEESLAAPPRKKQPPPQLPQLDIPENENPIYPRKDVPPEAKRAQQQAVAQQMHAMVETSAEAEADFLRNRSVVERTKASRVPSRRVPVSAAPVPVPAAAPEVQPASGRRLSQGTQQSVVTDASTARTSVSTVISKEQGGRATTPRSSVSDTNPRIAETPADGGTPKSPSKSKFPNLRNIGGMLKSPAKALAEAGRSVLPGRGKSAKSSSAPPKSPSAGTSGSATASPGARTGTEEGSVESGPSAG